MTPMKKKAVVFHGDSEKQLREFPREQLDKTIFGITQLQHGERPNLKTKPMQGLGDGVMEFIIKNGHPAFRCVYVLQDDVVHVLHAFSKTSTGTDSKHEKTIKLRYKNIKKS